MHKISQTYLTIHHGEYNKIIRNSACPLGMCIVWGIDQFLIFFKEDLQSKSYIFKNAYNNKLHCESSDIFWKWKYPPLYEIEVII